MVGPHTAATRRRIPGVAPTAFTVAALGLAPLMALAQGPRPAAPPPIAAPAATAATAPTPTIPWLDTVRAAARARPSVKVAQANVEQQVHGVDSARAGYYPRIQAGVSAGQQAGQSRGSRAATLSATQMIYDFGKVSSSVRSAEAGVDRQRALLHKEVDSVIELTAQALLELHRNQALERIADAQMVVLRDIVRITERRSQEGASSRTDPLQARARLEAAEASRTNWRAQQDQWRSRLQALLGGARVAGQAEPAPQDILDIAVARQPARWDELPAAVAARADLDDAQARLDGARAQRYPTVALQADLTRNLNAPTGARKSDRAMYLTLNSTVFQGGQAQAYEAASASALEAAGAQIEATRVELEDRQRSLQLQAASLRDRASALERRSRTMTQTRSLYREQYLSLGTRSALDLLNAEQEIGQAEQDLVNSRHDYWLTQVSYLVAAGLARDVFGVPVDDPSATEAAREPVAQTQQTEGVQP